jgi:hypothetical protein
LKFIVKANVLPVPAYVFRIQNADVAHGEAMSVFKVWPTAHPQVLLEAGEKLSLSFRVRPATAGEVKLAPGAPETVKLRREPGGDYWLDVLLEGGSQAGWRKLPVSLQLDGGPRDVAVEITYQTVTENLTVAPRELDLGEFALSDIRAARARPGRVSIRKQVGAFKIKSISSSLPFLKFDQQIIVEGRNYLFRIAPKAEGVTGPGAYNGNLTIETDDPQKPRLVIPVRLSIVDR